MRQVKHFYAHDDRDLVQGVGTRADIPSVTDMNQYPHYFSDSNNNLHVKIISNGSGGNPDVYKVTEWFVNEKNGDPVYDKHGFNHREVFVNMSNGYDGAPKDITDFQYQGYNWDTNPRGGAYTAGEPDYTSLDRNRDVYMVYKEKPGVMDVTVSKIVGGRFVTLSKDIDFEFTIWFKDSEGDSVAQGTLFSYIGGTVPDIIAIAPLDGDLPPLDAEGKTTFTLKHGQAIIIRDVRAEYQVKIVETDPIGFIPSFTDDQGISYENENDTDFRIIYEDGTLFAFVNYQDPVPGGIADDLWGFAAVPLAAALALSVLVIAEYAKRKKSD
jgi:hypothetical protein